MTDSIIVPRTVPARSYGVKNLWITSPDYCDKNKLLEFPEIQRAVELFPSSIYHFWYNIDDVWHCVHHGLVIDFRSSPWFTWSRLPPKNGLGDESFLIHDFERRFFSLLGMTERESDQRFRRVLEHYGLGLSRVQYLAVRVGAFFSGHEGIGKPSRKVRKAMKRMGDDWRTFVQDQVSACAAADVANKHRGKQ